MSNSEKYTATFRWPYTEPSVVIVTGSFDEWSQSVRLQKREDGFQGTAEITWNEKIAYKFVVDGQWVVNSQEPTEADNSGNVNNVFTAPEKPSEASRPNGTLEEFKSAPENAVGKPTTPGTPSILPQVVSDLATIMAATDGTSSALGYVASGVGAAIQGVIGIDPINPDQMSVKSPISPYPPTPNAVVAATEEPSPPVAPTDGALAAVTHDAVESTSLPDAEAATPTVEPSTHTPVDAVPLSPQDSTVISVPPTEAEVIPSTHTPIVPSTEPSTEAIPVTSPTDAAISSSPSTEASTHGPIVAPASVDTPAAEPVTSVAATENDVPAPAPSTQAETQSALPAEPTTPTKKSHQTNGTGNETASTPTVESPVPRPSTSSILSTPSKRSSRILSFPSRGSPTPDSSPSSKFESPSTRAKRKSIFGKMSIKNLFGKEKEKEK